jgi:hypothetical protein
VRSCLAIACFVFCCSFMACSSCHASTRLIATASTSSRIPSSSRKLSTVEPLWFVLLRFFLTLIGVPFGACSCCSSPAPNPRPASFAFSCEAVEQNYPVLLVDVKEHSCDSVLRQARPHFVNAITQGLAHWHPTGQPNSTVLISSPIRFRSSGEGRFFSQSRTGSPPASVRKKIAGTRLPCLSTALDSASTPVGDLGFLPTSEMYHIRYILDK